MSKRANNEGSIRQRSDGRWEARYSAGYDGGTGKLIRKSIYGKTQNEVIKKLREIEMSLSNGEYTPPNKITLGEWLDTWYSEYIVNVTSATKKSYEEKIRIHIKPVLGSIRMQKLTIPQIQKFYNSLTKDKALSPKTVKGVHSVLHAALCQAVSIGYLKVNPTEYCTLPKIIKKDIQPLTDETTALFITEIKRDIYEPVFFIDVFTGLRQGEILGLTWDCIDFKENRITVNKQLTKEKQKGSKSKYVLAPTKTTKTRVITAAPTVMDKLREVKAKQSATALSRGRSWQNKDNFVFTNEIGEHLKHHTVYKHFKQIAADIGIPNARFHDLRHSYAVSCLQSGDDIKTVQDNLGHSSASFTLSTYAHSTEKSKSASATRTEEYIKSILNA